MSSKSKKKTVDWKKIGSILLVAVLLVVAWRTGVLRDVFADLLGINVSESQEESEPGFVLVDSEEDRETSQDTKQESKPAVIKGQKYYSKDDVALYLHLYGQLPPNYLTKSQAEKKGWVASKGNLWKVTDKGCIGGDRFGNREKIVPNKSGRVWYEADVNYRGGYRGEERLLYSNDGLIYYTNDHYETATRLY